MSRALLRPRVLLLGMMGAGKTSVGRILARRLGWPLFDSDEMLVAARGCTAQELLRRDGEAALRKAEADALHDAVAGPTPAVVTVAAGTILDPGDRELIRGSGLVAWLRADIATLATRTTRGADTDRPWLGGDAAAALARLYQGRAQLYAEVADMVVDVDRLSPGKVADRVLGGLGGLQ